MRPFSATGDNSPTSRARPYWRVPNSREGPVGGVGLRAELPSLRWLMVADGGVQSFDGLATPQLEWLRVADLEPVHGGLDLTPLAAFRELRGVTLMTVGEVSGWACGSPPAT